MHESCESTNKGFVYFYFFSISAKLPKKRPCLHGKANPVHHGPSRLLRDAKRTVNFIGANPVLAVANHPSGDPPLIHANCRILKDCPDFNSELLFAPLTKPNFAGRDKRLFRRTTSRADDPAVRPAKQNGIVEGAFRIREERDCLLQRLRKLQFGSQ